MLSSLQVIIEQNTKFTVFLDVFKSYFTNLHFHFINLSNKKNIKIQKE